MSGKFTRRELAAALSAPMLLAQPPSPAPPQDLSQNPPQNPQDELKAARDRLHQISGQLDKFPLPMATEPAVHFKA